MHCRLTPVGHWHVMLCTRGGNQSWSGTTKHFDRPPLRLPLRSRRGRASLVHAEQRRRSPHDDHARGPEVLAVRDRTGYAATGADERWTGQPRIACRTLGGIPKRSNGADCKFAGYAFAGSNPAPAIPRFRARQGARRNEIAWWELSTPALPAVASVQAWNLTSRVCPGLNEIPAVARQRVRFTL